MCSKVALSVENVTKCYDIYEKPHERLFQMIFSRFGKNYAKKFWAIRDVSFSIPKGTVVGVLGKNGAGKSTLLQMICGTLAPTMGNIVVNGRVSALLELGSGFNPEFTGIENIYLNGQILGLSEEDISAKLQDILDFADIGDFVNQPVKTYSSGMFARLAFSVAINVNPDILIVDEALSVGDAWFQHKSMAKMRQLMETGCSVLFVSHSIDAVRALCDEAIWLEQGAVKMQGNVTEVTNAYMNDVFIEHNRIMLQAIGNDERVNESLLSTISLDDIKVENKNIEPSAEKDLGVKKLDSSTVLTVRSKTLRNSQGQVTEHLQQGEAFTLEFEIEIHNKTKNLSVGFLIKDHFGQELTGESYFNKYKSSLDFEAGQVGKFIFGSTMLLRGGQSYSVALRVNQVSKWDRSDNVILFADELAMIFDVLVDSNDPIWFKFKMPFEVVCR